MNNYLVDLKIDGEDLVYLNKMIRFITSEHSNRSDVLRFNQLISKEMLKNEHYIIAYYIEFFCNIKSLSKLDLNAIKTLIHIDRDMFVGNPHIALGEVMSVAKEDQGALIEQMVCTTLEEIAEVEVTEETFEEASSVLQEIINNLEVQNLIYASSMIFFEGKKVGRETLKGREGYVEFLTKGLMNLRNKTSGTSGIQKVDREYMLNSIVSGEELFPHPMDTVQDSWGPMRGGDCLSLLAPMNVGKTTVALNYVAQSLISGINTAIFISEMNRDRVISRVISIIGARKYSIRIPTNIITTYYAIEERRTKGEILSVGDKNFLTKNELYINNIEFIFNAMMTDSNTELGTLYIIKDLVLRDMDATMEVLAKEYDVRLLVVDHVNGVQAGYTVSNSERINNAYVMLNSLGKKYGVATVISNHIPEDQLSTLADPTADKSQIRGSDASQSNKTPDYTLILYADMQQKTRGELIAMTNKDRNTNTFFDPFLTGIHIDVGMVYEIELE